MVKKLKYHEVNFKHIYQELVRIECDEVEQFIKTMQSALNREYLTFEEFVKEQLATVPEHRRDEVGEWYAEDADGLRNRYPRILWQVVFVSEYSLFEQQMNGLCRRIRNIARSKGIAAATVQASTDTQLPGEKCLRSFGIRLARTSKEWKRFQSLVGVRNLIVHNRGHLRKDDESARVRAFVRRAKHITIDHHNKLVLSMEFCVKVVELMRRLLAKTVTAIPKKLF
jgi:hypothetical protein